MTDLEELFRPLIDESAPYREPVGVIEARVSERRVRRRRVRAQYQFGAAFLAVALIVTAVGVVRARDDGRAPARPGRVAPTTTSLPSVVAPAGWSTYDYGLARLSIPPGWTAVTGCPGPRTLVLTDPNNAGLGCGAGGTPSVDVSPLRSTDCGVCVPNASVNGIPYETAFTHCVLAQCPTVIYVPALKVAISFSGDNGGAILQTLTSSTYARVLQQPFGPLPSSWKTVTFDGFSVRVPANWPTVDLAKEAFDPCDRVPNTVYVGEPRVTECGPPSDGINGSSDHLEPHWSLSLVSGNALDPHETSTAPLPIEWHHSGLRFSSFPNSGPTPPPTSMELNVAGAHGRLLLQLGLGVDPAVARGILGSLKPLG